MMRFVLIIFIFAFSIFHHSQETFESTVSNGDEKFMLGQKSLNAPWKLLTFVSRLKSGVKGRTNSLPNGCKSQNKIPWILSCGGSIKKKSSKKFTEGRPITREDPFPLDRIQESERIHKLIMQIEQEGKSSSDSEDFENEKKKGLSGEKKLVEEEEKKLVEEEEKKLVEEGEKKLVQEGKKKMDKVDKKTGEEEKTEGNVESHPYRSFTFPSLPRNPSLKFDNKIDMFGRPRRSL